MSVRTLILGFALALAPTALATEDEETEDAVEAPAEEGDEGTVPAPALDREELKQVLASSVKLEIDAFRVLIGVVEKAANDGKGGENASVALDRARAAFAEAEAMADAEHY